MPPPVTAQALLQCSFGLSPAPLQVPPTGPPVMIEGKEAATIQSHVPMMNVGTFGLCRSLANPTVAAATAAALGVLTSMPCVPATSAPWLPGAPTVMVNGQPVLVATSQCLCVYGGVVTVTMPGAVTTAVS